MGPPPFGLLSRKAPSSAPSARSWVYPYNQPQEPVPTPQRVNYPLPVQDTNRNDKHRALHVVNVTRSDEEIEEDHEAPSTNSLGMEFGRHHEPPLRVPPSKKSFLGKVFGGGVGRNAFLSGKDDGSPSNRKLKRKATYNSDATYGGSLSAQPHSQTSTSFDEPGPSNLGIRLPHPTTTIPELPESEDTGSPPPNVVRLSDNVYPAHSINVYPPTGRNLGRPSHFVEGPTTESSHGHNLANERTTFMIYESNPSQYAESRSHGQVHTTPAVSRQPSSSSYVNPAPASLQPVRPQSFTPSVARVPVPPIDQPSAPPTRRTSLASPAGAAAPPPPRSRQQSLNRGVPSHSPATRSGLRPPLPDPPGPPATFHIVTQPLSPSAPPTAGTDFQSPVSAHPLPTDDYAKMTLSPTSNDRTVTGTTGTTFSYDDPSFSSDRSPLVRFFRTLYRLPWISHDRVTVDYRPDEGLLGSKAKKKRGKRMSTWYRSVLARSRRSSATIDLLGSVHDRKRNVDASLGAALAGFGSPFSSARRRRGSGKENDYDKTHRHRGHRHHHHHHQRSSSRRHHRHHHRSRNRYTTSTEEDDDLTVDSAHQRTPLIPALYHPYAGPYPPFPIAQGYAAYPFAPPINNNNNNNNEPPSNPQAATGTRGGMRSMTSTAPVYTPSPGPTPYATAPVYVFPAQVPPPRGYEAHHLAGGNAAGIPPVLVPGAVDAEPHLHHHHHHHQHPNNHRRTPSARSAASHHAAAAAAAATPAVIPGAFA